MVKYAYDYSDTVEEGKVIRQDPGAGADASKGATVTITVSQGKEVSEEVVPNVVGMTEIEDYCKRVGLNCVMTGDYHVRCSTRTAEALLEIEAATGSRADIVVMVQGDEPMVRPEMIDAAVRPLLDDPAVNVTNLMAEMETVEEFEDPNEVKVVVDRASDALYFSREPIPSRKKGADKVPMRKQVCIIPFRRDYLLRFNEMEESPLEIYESVDMLRILEHGEKVRMVPTATRTWSVDTPEDLARVSRLMDGDDLMAAYAQKAR